MRLWLSARGAPPFELQRGKDVVIGRGGDCDLSLYSSMLSREHACVRWENGVPVLFDLESLNGTYVGPVRVHRHRLRDADLIRLADVAILFRECEEPPPPPPEWPGPLPLPSEPAEELEPEAAMETRLYSRTQLLQQRMFEYDELGWLGQQLARDREAMLDERLGASDLTPWFLGNGGDEEQLWRLLRLGVLRPRDPQLELRELPAAKVAESCRLTKRAEKLRGYLRGKKTIWNEIASLRYETRLGPLFEPLRAVARAYRPGRGLTEVDMERLIYELTRIYAAALSPEVLGQELRRLQALGFIAPADDCGREAWYPRDWTDGTVEIASRGRAMLEGFRLEE